MNSFRGYSPLETGVLAAILLFGMTLGAFVLANADGEWAGALIVFAGLAVAAIFWIQRRRKSRGR